MRGCGRVAVTIGPAVYSCKSVPQIPHHSGRTLTAGMKRAGLRDVLDVDPSSVVEHDGPHIQAPGASSASRTYPACSRLAAPP